MMKPVPVSEQQAGALHLLNVDVSRITPYSANHYL
jgi:hypothetical protein